jgi:RNA polymerase sigma-70 factor (ECF subfamily)
VEQAKRQIEFQTTIDQHRKILYKICHLYCADSADREDLGQEILVQLWRSFPSFDRRCRFSTWMYRVALNTAISFRRSESSRKRLVDTAEPLLLDLAPAPESESEETQAMYRIIASLPPLHRALVLLYLDGNSQEEMAAILGITPSNVATRLNRLKISMRQRAAGSTERKA